MASFLLLLGFCHGSKQHKTISVKLTLELKCSLDYISICFDFEIVR